VKGVGSEGDLISTLSDSGPCGSGKLADDEVGSSLLFNFLMTL